MKALFLNSRRPRLRFQMPRFPEMAVQRVVGFFVPGEPLAGVVPMQPVAGSIRDVGQQAGLRQLISVSDIARCIEVARFDRIEKLAQVSGRIGNRGRGARKIVHALTSNPHFIASVIRHQRRFGAFE